jgi:hypothetical protein
VRIVCTRSKKGGQGAEVVFCVVGEVPLMVEPVQGLAEDVQWQRANQAVTASVSMHVRKELESQRNLGTTRSQSLLDDSASQRVC